MYEWFDPHEAKRTADTLQSRVSDARSAGYNEGKRDFGRILESTAMRAFTLAAERLGEQMSMRPEVKEAIHTVANGIRQNADYEVRVWDNPSEMSKMVVQRVNVRPFNIDYGIKLDPQDMMRERYYG